MDISKLRKKLNKFINKYKYVCIIIFLGVFFLLLPSDSEKPKSEIYDINHTKQTESVEMQLNRVLSKISGAGEVEVFLATISEEEIIYQEDYTNGKDHKNADTVIITDSERNQTGLIKKRLSPVYRGAVVVCEGADQAGVCLSIIEAVKNATGLRSDQISVLKMK